MRLTVFEHNNFLGTHQEFEVGFYNLPPTSGFVNVMTNDKISSFRLSGSSGVAFYEHVDGGGRALEFTNPSETILEVPSVGAQWNDVISSIHVYPLPMLLFTTPTPPPRVYNVTAGLRGVILYEAAGRVTGGGFLGPRAQRFDVGDYDLPHNVEFTVGGIPGGLLLGVRPKAVSSISVGPDYYVELYDGPQQRGRKLTVNENAEFLRGLDMSLWDDTAVSIRVLQIPGLR
jgi:hypothetical protein